MKKWILVSVFLSFTFGNIASAQTPGAPVADGLKYPAGRFRLVEILPEENPPVHGVPCAPHVELILDQGKIVGNVAFHTETVPERCHFVAMLPEWHYRMGKPESIGCGSVRIAGVRSVKGGTTSIEVTDHRSRRCTDQLAGVLLVKETSEDGTVNNYYGEPIVDTVVDPVICQAHWEGYYFNDLNDTCEPGSSSGCSNPFPYETIVDCRGAHPYE